MDKNRVQEYNAGNLKKYNSRNPIKQRLICSLHDRMLKKSLELVRGGDIKILDAGCGEGFFCSKLHKAFPSAIIKGCDAAEEALSIARNSYPEMDFEKANLYELPYVEQEFDLVVCSEVLEHLGNPEKAVRELCRIAKNLIITVPNEPWFRLGNLISLNNVSRFGDPVDHINHWTYSGFKRFITSEIKIGTELFGFERSFPWTLCWVRYDNHK